MLERNECWGTSAWLVRSGVAVLASVMILAVPNLLFAQSMYDEAWGDEGDIFTDTDPGAQDVYGCGITDGDYGHYEVDATLRDSNGTALNSHIADGWGTHIQSDVQAGLDWYSSSEGTYDVESTHSKYYNEWSAQFLGFFNLFFDVGRHGTRYYYVGTTPDGLYQYSRWFCGNRCQKDTLFLYPNFTATPYIQGLGWYVSVFGLTRCNTTYSGRSTTIGLACYPAN